MKDAFKHIGWFFKEQWKKYVICAILLLVVSILPVFPARILGTAIDEIANGTINSTKLAYYVGLLFLIPLFTYIFNIFYHYIMNYLGHTLSYKLREKYIDHLFDLDVKAYEGYTKGDLIARATNDLNSLTMLATTFLQQLIYFVAFIISALVMMVSISSLLTVASVLFMPIAIFFLNKKRIEKRKYYRTHHEIYSAMTENVLESIEGVKTVRAYCQEEQDYKKTKTAIDNDVNSWWVILDFEALFQPLFEIIYAVAYTIAISLGCYLVIKNEISPGDLVSFLIYVGMLYSPLVGLSNILNIVNNITISDTRVSEIMKLTPQVYDNEESKEIHKFEKIEFKNVSFKYEEYEFDVIKNITFEINRGETIGIVGPTGSGKSTLIRQLLREFNVTSGNIYIDGEDIKNYIISDVRDLVGYVPQNHILFRRTVEDNIIIGNPNADKKQIQIAINAADFQKDIDNLPYGEQTMVSELGGSLSGGQQQRLSIARALVKDPEILILDDSLSAVDAITEENIINNLKEIRQGKTNIIISHRFASISKADKIYVICDGVISEEGNHEKLMSYDNWYSEQYQKQMKGE